MISTITIVLWLATVQPVAGATDAAYIAVSASQCTAERSIQKGGCPARTELQDPTWQTSNARPLPVGEHRLHTRLLGMSHFDTWRQHVIGSGGPVGIDRCARRASYRLRSPHPPR